MKIKHCLTLLTALFVTCVCLLITTTSCAESVLSISSPSNGKSYTTDSSITIKWNKITGAAGYHVSVRNIDNDELVLERAWTTSTSMKISSYIEDPGTYKVWVGAVETKGAASIEAWQDDIHIYVSLSSPDISYPIDESTCSAGESIKLQWDSVTGADGYRYYIKQLSGTPDRSNKNEPYINQWNGRTSSTRRYYTLAGSNIKSGYWYKFVVEAYKSGYDSGWSDWCYVYVEKKTLDKPVISYPVNNNTYTANQSIKLQWSSVSGADGYTYYIKQLQGEPDYVSETEASIAEWSNSTTSTYYTLSASNVKGGYWYKFVVEAYASGANSGWSTWCYVYINQPTLDKPVITSPSTSQTYPANQGITLKWNSVSGAEGYQYYIKQLSGEPDYVSETEASVNDWSSSTTSTSYSLAATNVKGGYWYKFVVRAYASGVESWSEWRYVYIPFDKAVITTPTNWSEVNAGTSITVKWNAVSGADAYKSHIIRLKGEPNTSNDSEQKLALSVDGSYQGEWRIDRGTTRSYTLNGSYVVGGYWYKIVIEAKNTTKGISSWSNWYYVYANETGNLERPVITSPVAYQNYEAGDPISFVWQAVDNATSYKYYIKQLVGEPDNSDNEQAANSWIGEVKASNRRYTLPGKYVQPNTWYKFVVEAKADGYYSGWSRYTYIKIPDRVDWIHYVLPEAMTEISDESFEGNKLLRTFDASKSELSSIGSRAFANCTNLLSINLPINVESIAEDAFTNCPNLTIHCIKGSAAETYANRKKIAVEIHGVAMDTDTVKLSQSNWDVAYAEKAEASVRVTSSGDWSASSNRTWLRVNKTTGSNGTNIVLTADENSTGQKRSGTITFTCGNAKAYLEVSQNNIYASVATEATAKPAPIVTGSWNDSSTITVTLGGTYQLSGYVNVQNGYLGNVSVSVQGGSDRALNNDYAGSVSMINLSEESFFNINTSTNTNFNKAGTYRLVMYAKAYGSTNAIKIGEKTLIVEEPVAVQKPVVSFTRTSATVLNNGTGKFNLTVSTTYTDMFYVELLKNGTPVDIYDDYVKTVQKREYNETDFKNVATLYTTSKKTWPMLSAITIPSGAAEGTYTIRVTAVNNQGKSSTATANLEVVSKIPMQTVKIGGEKKIRMAMGDEAKELVASFTPTNATEKIIEWKVSDNSIVNIQKDGNSVLISPLKPGSTRITAYNKENEKTYDYVDLMVVHSNAVYLFDNPSDFDKAFMEKQTVGLVNNYIVNESAIEAQDIERSSSTIKNKLDSLGFESIWLKDFSSGQHTVAYAFGYKFTVNENGSVIPLVAVILRGTPPVREEWLSNFTMGDGSDHLGFYKAEERVLKDLKSYINSILKICMIDGTYQTADYKLWIAGHSRGAAVGNILSSDMSAYVKPQNLYSYLFATPNVTQNYKSSVNVHNYVIYSDLVPHVPLTTWGYGKNGTTHILYHDKAEKIPMLKGTLTDQVMNGFINDIGAMYPKKQEAQKLCDSIIKLINDEANNSMDYNDYLKLVKVAFTLNFNSTAIAKAIGTIAGLPYFNGVMDMAQNMKKMGDSHSMTHYRNWISYDYPIN